MTRRQAGFTLVELLLAVTLMSLLLALAYGGLRAASRASEAGQEVLNESSRLRITHQFIRKQLNLILPLAFEDTQTEPPLRVSFEGEASRVLFVGPMPGYLARGGPQVQLMEFVDGEEGLQLQFSHAPLLGFEREMLEERDPVVLLEGLDGGGFSFLAYDEEGLATEWIDSWEEQPQPPTVVRLDLDFGEGSAVEWPPLISAARLDPSTVVPGGGGGETYAERIQEMIQGQRGQRGSEEAQGGRERN